MSERKLVLKKRRLAADYEKRSHAAMYGKGNAINAIKNLGL
jgi:hypothetical protein